jgi:pyruvate formate lyase activating enzyme
MVEALFYNKLPDKKVQCQLCPNYCLIDNHSFGICNVRKNIKGKLEALNYGKACTTSIDPIEKKPLYHFLPNTNTYSLATVGCNLKCFWCQNWEISQTSKILNKNLEPQQIINNALNSNCKSISYTYTEPTIFYEYVLDIARLAKQHKLMNVVVSNGYINKEPLEELYHYIDVANIDLKGFTEIFYKEYCGAKLKPVLETLINIKNLGIHLEITYLIIPTLNDSPRLIKKMCDWIKTYLDDETPLHFSRFFPMYKAKDIPPTPIKTLKEAYNIAKSSGLKHIYVGNIGKIEDTECPKCGCSVVERDTKKVKIIYNKCIKCKTKIEGIWHEF